MPFACLENQSQTTGTNDDNWAHNLQFQSEGETRIYSVLIPTFSVFAATAGQEIACLAELISSNRWPRQ